MNFDLRIDVCERGQVICDPIQVEIVRFRATIPDDGVTTTVPGPGNTTREATVYELVALTASTSLGETVFDSPDFIGAEFVTARVFSETLELRQFDAIVREIPVPVIPVAAVQDEAPHVFGSYVTYTDLRGFPALAGDVSDVLFSLHSTIDFSLADFGEEGLYPPGGGDAFNASGILLGNQSASIIPEPGAIVLLGCSLPLLARRRRTSPISSSG